MRATRRAILSVAAVGATGCLGNDGDGNDGNGTEPPDEAENAPSDPGNATDTEGNENETDGDTDPTEEKDGEDETESEDAPEVDWNEADEYRKWLTDAGLRENSSLRFEYTDGYRDSFVGARVEPLGLSPEGVDAHVTQSGRTVHLGDFDTETLLDGVEEAEGYEATGEYEGYTVVEGTVNGTTVELAVGDDAVVVGEGYEAHIDSRLGDRDRLEDVEPDFTLLFEELPDRGSISGQQGLPTGSGVDAEGATVSGTASDGPGGTTTWVFVFESADQLTDGVLVELEGVVRFGEATSTERDGRVARVVGEVPEPGEGNFSG
jgi:hypothetical protein